MRDIVDTSIGIWRSSSHRSHHDPCAMPYHSATPFPAVRQEEHAVRGCPMSCSVVHGARRRPGSHARPKEPFPRATAPSFRRGAEALGQASNSRRPPHGDVLCRGGRGGGPPRRPASTGPGWTQLLPGEGMVRGRSAKVRTGRDGNAGRRGPEGPGTCQVEVSLPLPPAATSHLRPQCALLMRRTA